MTDITKVGETLSALQHVIERNATELEEINTALKSYRESMNNIFDNDQSLADAEEAAQVIKNEVKQRKAQLNVSPEVNQIKANMAELKERKVEIEEALNNHLLNLYQITGSKTYDTSNGETREFNIKAKVKGVSK